MDIARKDLVKYKKIGKGANGNVYSVDDKAVKVFKNTYKIEEKENKIKELLIRGYVDGTGYPLDKVFIDDEFYGYTALEYKNSVCFSSKSAFKYDLNERVKAIYDVSGQLRELHNLDYVFNDVNSNNLIINKDGGHIIDFDEGAFLGRIMGRCSYLIYHYDGKVPSYKKSDCVKMIISCLGLLYRFDIEGFIMKRSVIRIDDLLDLFSNNKEALEIIRESVAGIYGMYDKEFVYLDQCNNDIFDKDKVSYYRKKLKKKMLEYKSK